MTSDMVIYVLIHDIFLPKVAFSRR